MVYKYSEIPHSYIVRGEVLLIMEDTISACNDYETYKSTGTANTSKDFIIENICRSTEIGLPLNVSMEINDVMALAYYAGFKHYSHSQRTSIEDNSDTFLEQANRLGLKKETVDKYFKKGIESAKHHFKNPYSGMVYKTNTDGKILLIQIISSY